VVATILDIKAYLLKFLFDFLGRIGLPVLDMDLPRDLELSADLRYGPATKQRLDILRCAGTGSRPLPVLVYFHGGGWISADKRIYRGIAAAFACKGFLTFNVNYRLAPRDRFAAPLADAHLAIDWICRHAAGYGGDCSALVLAGDSAGAQIASWYASARQQEGLLADIGIGAAGERRTGDPGHRSRGAPTEGAQVAGLASAIPADARAGGAQGSILKGLLLFYGVYDFETVLAARFPFIRIFARSFLGADPATYARNATIASPLRQVSPDLPPVWLCAGERDGLFAQSVAYAEALSRQGVRCRTLFFPAADPAYHGFFFFRRLAISKAALRSALAFLRECAGVDCQTQ